MRERRLYASVLAVSMLVLTACGRIESGTTGGEASKEAAAEVKGRAQETVEIITFLTKDYYIMPEMTDKFSKQFKEKTERELKIPYVPNNSQEEKIAATFVGGSMPDIARLPTDIYPFVRQDFLVPLDEYVEASPEVKAVLETNPEVIRPYQFFGKIYGMSITGQKYMAIWARTDRLDKLGITMSVNTEELENTLVLFRDNDLDGNGKKDTIPPTLSAILKNQDMFTVSFGTRNEVFMKDGEAVAPFITEDHKSYTGYMEHLYTEKLIDLEMPTNTGYGTTKARFINNEIGPIIMWGSIYDTLKLGLEKGGIADASLEHIIPYETDHGAFGMSYYEANSPTGTTSQCKDLKTVFDSFFTWLLTDPDAIISTSHEVEGYGFDVVDGVYIPNMDNNGVGFHGQSFPPINAAFEYPFTLDDTTTKGYESIASLADLGKNLGDLVVTEMPEKEFGSYCNIRGDLTAKVTGLYHNYVLGNIEYEEYLNSFNRYASEIGLEEIIAEMNK